MKTNHGFYVIHVYRLFLIHNFRTFLRQRELALFHFLLEAGQIASMELSYSRGALCICHKRGSARGQQTPTGHVTPPAAPGISRGQYLMSVPRQVLHFLFYLFAYSTQMGQNINKKNNTTCH